MCQGEIAGKPDYLSFTGFRLMIPDDTVCYQMIPNDTARRGHTKKVSWMVGGGLLMGTSNSDFCREQAYSIQRAERREGAGGTTVCAIQTSEAPRAKRFPTPVAFRLICAD